MVGAARLVGKYGEKQTTTKKTLRLPWMEMGQRTDDSETRGSTTQEAETTMCEMDEVGEALQDCEGAGLCILHRATQRYALRFQRRKFVHEQMGCCSQQRCERLGLVRRSVTQQWIDEATGAMDTETEYTVQQEAGGLSQPGRCSSNGRLSFCSGSNLEYCGEHPTFLQTSQSNIQGTNIELQRAFGCSPCTQQFFFQPEAQQNPQPAPPFGQYLSSFQHQQVGSRTKLDFSAEKDSICMSSIGSDSEGNSYSRRQERDSRLAVKTRNRRRLRDSDSKSSQSRSSTGSRPRCGRIRKHKKQEKTDMEWARKLLVHGRSGRRLEGRSHLCTPPVPLIMPCLSKAHTERARVVLFLPA